MKKLIMIMAVLFLIAPHTEAKIANTETATIEINGDIPNLTAEDIATMQPDYVLSNSEAFMANYSNGNAQETFWQKLKQAVKDVVETLKEVYDFLKYIGIIKGINPGNSGGNTGGFDINMFTDQIADLADGGISLEGNQLTFEEDVKLGDTIDETNGEEVSIYIEAGIYSYHDNGDGTGGCTPQFYWLPLQD